MYVTILPRLVARHCVSGDIMVIFSQVISKDHVTKGSCDLTLWKDAPYGKSTPFQGGHRQKWRYVFRD